jgi:hypothetical protein
MTTGWMLRSSCERDWARISPAINQRGSSSRRSLSFNVWINASRRTQDDHACRPISTLLILCPTEFNHIFCGGVSDVDLAKNRISVVCETEKKGKNKKSIPREEPNRCWTAGTHIIPPIGSRIIFSMDLGPRHVRMTSATV